MFLVSMDRQLNTVYNSCLTSRIAEKEENGDVSMTK